MNYPAIPREFFNGDCFDAYRILGAHPCSDNGTEGWRFAVWAPGATAVEVCGGFDGWEAGVPMEKADTGVWSAFVPGPAAARKSVCPRVRACPRVRIQKPVMVTSMTGNRRNRSR